MHLTALQLECSTIITWKMYAHTLYILGLCIQIHERQHGYSTSAQWTALHCQLREVSLAFQNSVGKRIIPIVVN